MITACLNAPILFKFWEYILIKLLKTEFQIQKIHYF